MLIFVLTILSFVIAGECKDCDPERIYDGMIVYTVDDVFSAFPTVEMDPERDTDEYRDDVFAWFYTQYGIDLDHSLQHNDPVFDGAAIFQAWKFSPEGKMIIQGLDIQDIPQLRGQFVLGNAEFYDDGYMLIFNEDVVVYGKFGGEDGKTVSAGSFILKGDYRLFIDDEFITDFWYESNCPVSSMPPSMTPPGVTFIPVNCDVYNVFLGDGITRGLAVMTTTDEGIHVDTRYQMRFPKQRSMINNGNNGNQAFCDFAPPVVWVD